MKQFEGAKVLITGAAGFVGHHLIDKLISMNADVIGICRTEASANRLALEFPEIRTISCDLSDTSNIQEKLAGIFPNYVFHGATVRDEKNWDYTYKVNGLGTGTLLSSVASPHLKCFVNLGTSMVYQKKEGSFSESDTLKPYTHFGISKLSGEMLLSQIALNTHVPLSLLRIFHVYGPGEPTKRLIPTVIRNLLANKPIRLTEKGFCHDFIYVEDVVNGCLQAAQKAEGVFNIGTGIETTNEEIVSMIGEILGVTPEIIFGGYDNHIFDKKHWCANTQKSREELGWEAKVQVRQGLEKYVSWYLANNVS